MSLNELTDRQLVKQFQSGDITAFEELVLRHQDQLMRIALVTLYHSQMAEDAVQETFLRSYKGLSGFRFAAEPFTWLYRMLKNVCSEMNKKQLKQEQPKDMQVSEIQDDSGSLSDSFENLETSKKVKALVFNLPPQQKEVVILRVFEEMSVQQTAKILGCREGTVKANLHKAMKNLKLSKSILEI